MMLLGLAIVMVTAAADARRGTRGQRPFPKLAGGADDRPERNVGSYWPFAPT
jgi:hypothetical protein